MDQNRCDKNARNLRRKLALTVFLRYVIAYSSLVLFLWGAVIVLFKGLSIENILYYYAPASFLIIPLGLAIFKTMKKLPRLEVVKAMLDRHLAAGGLVTVSDECDIAAWQDRIPEKVAPTIQWDAKRIMTPFVLAMLFLVGSFFIPVRELIGAPNPIDISQELSQLDEKLDLLSEEDIIEEDLETEFQKDIDELEKRAKEGQSAGLWESLDHLEEQFKRTAEEKAMDLLNQAENDSLAESLAREMMENLDSLPTEAKNQAMQQLSKLASNAMQGVKPEDLEGLNPEELKKLMEKLKDMDLSPEDLAKLMKFAGQCKGNALGKMGRLVEVRLIDAKYLSRCKGKCKGDLDALIAYLSQCEGDCEGLCEGLCNMPGRGGVTRGRGDAAMTWKDPTSNEGMDFSEEMLPPGQFSSLENAELQGISIGDPASEQSYGPSGSGALNNASATGGTSRNYTLLPEHRKAVKKYFDQNKKEDQE